MMMLFHDIITFIVRHWKNLLIPVMMSICFITFTIFSTLIFSDLINEEIEIYAVLIFILIYLISVISGFIMEYSIQTFAASISKKSIVEYFDDFKTSKVEIHADNAEIHPPNGIFTMQLERFRSEYVIPVIVIISRLVLLFIAFVYLLLTVPAYLMFVLLTGILCYGAFVFIIHRFLKYVDARITQSLDKISAQAQKISTNFAYLFFMNDDLGNVRSFSAYYNFYGVSRAFGAIGSQAPRLLVEFVAILSILYVMFASHISLEGPLLAEIGLLALRLNPHIQVMIRNLTNLVMSNSAKNLYQKVESWKNCQKINLNVDDVVIKNSKLGKTLVLSGPSGCGKSTLARKLAYRMYDAGMRVCYIENNTGLPFERVPENILEKREFNEELKNLGLDKSILREGRQLSNGERQRLLFAIGLVKNCDMFILDETLSSLDHNNRTKMINRMQELDNKFVIIIWHQYDDILNLKNVEEVNVSVNSR